MDAIDSCHPGCQLCSTLIWFQTNVQHCTGDCFSCIWSMAMIDGKTILDLKYLSDWLTGSKLKDFKTAVDTDSKVQAEIATLRGEVEEFAKQFPTIGFEKSSMKYQHWTPKICIPQYTLRFSAHKLQSTIGLLSWPACTFSKWPATSNFHKNLSSWLR